MYLQAGLWVVLIQLCLRKIHRLSHLKVELLYSIFKLSPCSGIVRINFLVLLHIDENKSNTFHHCEDQMLAAVVPVLADLLKVQLACP